MANLKIYKRIPTSVNLRMDSDDRHNLRLLGANYGIYTLSGVIRYLIKKELREQKIKEIERHIPKRWRI